MVFASTMLKKFFAIIFVCVDIAWARRSSHSPSLSLIQTTARSSLQRPFPHFPPVSVTMDRGDLVISPSLTAKRFDEAARPHLTHPPDRYDSSIDGDGAYDPGYLGDHSNILQWIENAVIYAEVENIPRVRLNPEVHQFMKSDVLPGLPTVINVDRKEGRMDKNPVSSTCGTIQWDMCAVNITARAKIAEYYFKPLLPPACGDPQYDGLVIHLRRPERAEKEEYMQPPCQLYAFIIEKDHYTSIRVFGEAQNPCAKWLTNYANEHGIEMDNLVGRPFQADFCEAVHAKNFAMGISTMSQNAVLLGDHAGRHLYQMLPPAITDPFMYFGQQSKYFEQLCDLFDATGLTLDDTNYWNKRSEMAIETKMQSKTWGIKAKACK